MTTTTIHTASRALAAALEPLVDSRQLLTRVGGASAEVQNSFATYVNEALFFWRVLEPDIRALEPGSRVVEIGSGIGLLARLIAAEGHTVTAFEPEAAGFGRMHAISEMMAACWRGQHNDVTFVHDHFKGSTSAVRAPAPSLILAVNVIEHVPAPAQLIIAATRSLAPAGTARFICPNYAFPYEPHFNIPTAINKQLTHRLARRVIAHSSISEAEQFWSDLSWPTARALRHSLVAAGIECRFSRAALLAYSTRLDDSAFLERKGATFRFLSGAIRPIVRTGAQHIPITVAPVIDLTTSPSPLPTAAARP